MGLTIYDAARLVGVSVGAVSKQERGVVELDASMIDRYRRLYRVKPIQLFVEWEGPIDDVGDLDGREQELEAVAS